MPQTRSISPIGSNYSPTRIERACWSRETKTTLSITPPDSSTSANISPLSQELVVKRSSQAVATTATKAIWVYSRAVPSKFNPMAAKRPRSTAVTRPCRFTKIGCCLGKLRAKLSLIAAFKIRSIWRQAEKSAFTAVNRTTIKSRLTYTSWLKVVWGSWARQSASIPRMKSAVKTLSVAAAVFKRDESHNRRRHPSALLPSSTRKVIVGGRFHGTCVTSWSTNRTSTHSITRRSTLRITRRSPDRIGNWIIEP